MATNYYNYESVKTAQENLRHAKEEYKKVKMAVAHEIEDYLKQTGQHFTAMELSNKFGLSVRAIVNVIRYNARGIRSVKRTVTRKMVYLDENGNPNMDRVFTRNSRVNEYFYSEPASSRNNNGFYW
jgi:hypothetical protein